jgi:hypothetical protein
MEKRDVRSERRPLGPEHGFAETPQIALWILDDQEEPGVRRKPPRRSRHPQPERGHRGRDPGEPLEVGRLIDHRHVRFDRRGRLWIPAVAELIDAVA